MMAAERRGKLSLKRNRNVGDEPSSKRENPAKTPTSEVCNRGVYNSRVDPKMCVEDRLFRTDTVTKDIPSSRTKEIRQSQEWTSLPDLPPWFGFKGKETEDTPKHEIIKMGTVSIEWRPLPKHCQICLVRTRQKRATQHQELSTGQLILQTRSAALESGEQIPASLQRSKTSRNETKEMAVGSYLGRTVRKEDLPVIGSEAAKSETIGFKVSSASFKMEGKHKSVELIEEIDVERERSRRTNTQGSHSATVKNVDLGKRTVRKEGLPVDGSENHSAPQAKNAGVDLPPQGNHHSKSFEKKIDAGKLQMKKTSIKKPDAVQNLVQDLKKERPQAAKPETKGFKASPASSKTEGKHKSVELIEEFDVERERSRRMNIQGSHSSTVKNADSEATKSLVKNSNESYANLCVKDSNFMKVKNNDTPKELIEEFDFEKATSKQNCRPESENYNSHYQTSDGKISIKTVNQRSKDQLPSGSVVKCFPSPPAKTKSKMKNVDHSNSSITSHFKKCSSPLKSDKLRSVEFSKASSPQSAKLSSQLDKVSWKASPRPASPLARGETLDLKVSSPEIIDLDSGDDSEILPPSPIKQCSSSWSTSKRKLSEISSEKDETAVKKAKLVELVSTGPGTSGSLAKRSIPDQKSLSSSMAWQKQSFGKTTTSQTIKTLVLRDMKTTETRKDSKIIPNRCMAPKTPLFKRKPDQSGGATERPIEKFTRKADGSSGSIRVSNSETRFQTTLPNRQNFTKTIADKITAPASNLSKSPGRNTSNVAKHLGQKASPVEHTYHVGPIRPSQAVRGPETQRRVPEVANQWTAKTNQSGFQTANDIRTNRDVHSRPNDGNYQGSYPKQGITTHTPFTHKGTNQDIQHPNRGINQHQQANQGTKQDQTFKRDSIPSHVIESCPLCTIEFQQGWSQFERDCHIAECLSITGTDVTW